MSHSTPSFDEGAATLRAAAAELPGPQLEELVRLDRYEAGPLIGKGGMGEVRQCRDMRLHRHIALKTATTQNKAELSRFIREAQVQGQLEHPGIVPVHELGVGSDGAPYFAMKRVHGETLFEVLSRLEENDGEAQQKYPRRKLLNAFLAICQAVDYAHTHGWLHRDLKPANVMLGDFGEVYVLDWGIARRLNEKDDKQEAATLDAESPKGLTTPGSLMGTPGYMAPEQVHGDSADVRSDVYALGAILFEVLTHQMLAVGNSTIELLIDTRNGCDAQARKRAPKMEIAPELEAICVKATQKEPGRRFSSVRELHDAVDRVLAGERDTELRGELAKQHTQAAQLAVARSTTEPTKELEHRRTALRELGLSLALDQTYRPALEGLLELMTTPPKTVPPEAEADVRASQTAQVRAASRGSFFAFSAVALISATVMMHNVRHFWATAVSGGLFLAAALTAGWAGWKVRRPSALALAPSLFISTLAIMSLFWFDGPLTILPAFAAVNTLAYGVAMGRRWRPVTVSLGFMTVVVPLLGSWFGWLPESFRYVKEGLLLVPVEMEFSPTLTTVSLLAGFLGTIGVSSLVIGRMRDSLGDMMRTRALQSWNLKQLLPAEAVGPKETELSLAPTCPVEKVVTS